MTIDQAINVLAERTYENKRDLERKNLQRRNAVVDIYGERQYANSNGQATFMVSISKDMVYLERFQFKLMLTGLTIPVDTSASGITTTTSLAISGTSISPNPHSHGVIYDMSGVTHASIPSGAKITGVMISIPNGSYVDITAAMDAQYGSNSWRNIVEYKILPDEDLDRSFDIVQMACDLDEKGIISSGLRKIVVSTNVPCDIVLLNYLKYSHLNR